MKKRGEIFKSISGGRKLRTNAFDLSHEKKLTANMADLVPVYLQECVPGDKFKGSTEMIIKFAPMIFPVMHRINAYIHYFFVPNRLVWDNWKDFITGGVDGKANPTFPYLTLDESNKVLYPLGGLADYFGLPPIAQETNVTSSQKVNALPFRAYQTIYNEFYRDQTLKTEVPITKDDQVLWAEATELTAIRKRSWEKDYFTSALPWTQRGDDVLLPTDINYKPNITAVDGTLNLGDPVTIGAIGADQVLNTTGGHVQVENIEDIGTTINDLRQAITLQQWLEKNARAGGRYIEQILAHFGRRVPDYRLQRPELIGGGKQTVMISEVLANFESDTTALGKYAGHGVSVGNSSGFKYTADEHGYIIGILSVLPRTGYYQGINKLFFKGNRFDFYFPEFSHLGEQIVQNKELFYDPTDTAETYNEGIFGYQSRYAEYKYTPDSIHGEFRTTLEFGHLARKFTSQPVLNASFVEANPDTRIFAVQDESTQKLWIQLYNNIRAIRPMPVYGTPIL